MTAVDEEEVVMAKFNALEEAEQELLVDAVTAFDIYIHETFPELGKEYSTGRMDDGGVLNEKGGNALLLFLAGYTCRQRDLEASAEALRQMFGSRNMASGVVLAE